MLFFNAFNFLYNIKNDLEKSERNILFKFLILRFKSSIWEYVLFISKIFDELKNTIQDVESKLKNQKKKNI